MNEKKRVGIIGYWFATNYGGVASYYSLYKKVEALGYAPFLIENPYFESDKEGDDVFSRNFFRNEGFDIAKGLNNSHLDELNQMSDIFLLGSDQVFTSSSIRTFGKMFLMEFAKDEKKKIAFSASCGGDNLNVDAQLLDYARKLISRFDAVSVREYSAVDIIKEKFGINPEVVCDPIFFTPAEGYKELAGKAQNVSKDGEPYVLAYILDPTDDKRDCINKIAKHINLKKKVALDGRKFTYEDNAAKMGMGGDILPELDFYQWLYYFDKASYVITDSFHGAVMSLILNKPFVMYANRGRGYPRFVTLAKMFGIESRLIDGFNDLTLERIDESIDFSIVNARINEKKEEGRIWLEFALVKKSEGGNVVVRDQKPSMFDQLNSNSDFIKIRLLATLFRDYGVKHVVLSPGGRDVPLIRMFEYNEQSFVLHRVTDERSAAYYALGIAARLRRPVACVCTSGTAASNFLPAITEAFYTGIPIIAVTADRYELYHNQGEDQTIPQKSIYRDVVKKEISLNESSGWRAEYQTRRDISDCILETTHNGFGPVHINVPIDNIAIGAKAPRDYWNLLPFIYPHILRVGSNYGMEEMHRWVDSLRKSSKILVVYGQNAPITDKQREKINKFSSKYNCVFVTDHISNLSCDYCVESYNMLRNISQDTFNRELSPDILITVEGKRLMNDPLTYKIRGGLGNIRHWSVTPNGQIKDFYFRLSSVIEMSSEYFFEWFAEQAGDVINDGVYYEKWRAMSEKYGSGAVSGYNAIYVQSVFLPIVPPFSILHLGVGQSFFECRRFIINKNVDVYCNMGTNGIDGCTSSFMGQCAVEERKKCFLLVGDLSFFYDMNGIWNKPLNKNIRILMVNNNGSGLLRSHNLKAVTSVHDTSAEGWVKSTGFDYISAHSKEEFDDKIKYFISDEPNKALFFEVFCD